MKISQSLSELSFLKDNKNNVEESYLQFLSEIREDIQEENENEHLSEEFQEEFKTLIFEEVLNEYHPLKFFWLNLIDKLVDTLALIEEELHEPSDLIGVFSESDLLGFVVQQLEADVAPEQIFEEILELQELQIISFFHLHFSKDEWQPNGPVAYRLISELGDSKGNIFVGENSLHYSIPQLAEEAAIPIVGIFPERDEIQVLVKDKVETITGVNTVKEANGIKIFPGIPKEDLDFGHYEKASRGIQVLQALCPELLSLFKSYTKNIIPIYQEELVSFSMATLPTYSTINMDNRDHVDMVDDLTHENGHHFLNAILEGEEEVLFEDDDKIFFSPWRRSLRPVRGLYHAVVTFYWAYRLFKELTISDRTQEFFSPEEIEKINIRFLEEAELIRQCREDLDRAHEMGKISDFGKQISDSVLNEVESDKDIEDKIMSSLSQSAKDELQKQFELVSKARLA